MNDERVFLSEIERFGEQICVIRDIFERIPPPDCNECGLLRFCEEPRSDEDIEKLSERIALNSYRRDFFSRMEEDGNYD